MTSEVENVLSLADFDEAFNEAEVVEKGDFDEVPDGKYLGKVEKVTDFEPATSGGLRFSIWFKVATGKQKGRLLFKNYWLNKDKDNYKDALKYLKTDMVVMGLKVSKLTDVNERRAELLDLYVNLQKKTGKDPKYYNLYINSIGEAPTEDDEPVTPGQDLPF